MDLSTIIGLLAGIGMIAVAIADAGGGIDIFTSGSAYLIVLGGTLSATFVNFPFKAVIDSFKSAKEVFSNQEIQEITLIDKIVDLGKIKREKGVFGLEKEVENIFHRIKCRSVLYNIMTKRSLFLQLNTN